MVPPHKFGLKDRAKSPFEVGAAKTGPVALLADTEVRVLGAHWRCTRVTTFSLSRHAVQRALEMSLEPEFIRSIMLTPDAKWWNGETKHGGCWMFRRGDVNAPADEMPDGSFQIRTFLPATEERWRRESHDGRKFDPTRFK